MDDNKLSEYTINNKSLYHLWSGEKSTEVNWSGEKSTEVNMSGTSAWRPTKTFTKITKEVGESFSFVYGKDLTAGLIDDESSVMRYHKVTVHSIGRFYM